MGRLSFLALITLIYAFILLPILVVLVASVSTTNYLTFPPQGFTLRWFASLTQLDNYIDALRYSLVVAVAATVIAVVVGTWVALVIARFPFPGRAAVTSFFLAPIVLPELALAVGLLQYFSQTGFVRGTMAVVLAHSVICTPYAVRTVTAAAAGMDHALGESAASLGAPSWRVLWDVTLPLLKPGLISAGIMAFIISFDNVTISLFLSAPGAITLPALLFNQAAESGLNTTLAAVSAVLVLLMLGVMLLVERVIGLERFFESAVSGRRAA